MIFEEHHHWVLLEYTFKDFILAKSSKHYNSFLCFYIPIQGFPGSSAGEESASNAGDSDWIPRLARSSAEGIAYPLQYSGASLVIHMIKESACNAWDLGSTPGLGRSLEGEHSNPLQNSCLENPHGQRCLEAYSPWGHRESGTAEQLSTAHIPI